MKVPNPEQTASIFSLMVYSFLDPVIFEAYRVPHLSHERLPPLADYDYAKRLTEHAFPVSENCEYSSFFSSKSLEAS
jgi:hypothetical protein